MEAIEVERKMAVTAGNLRRKYAVFSTKLPDALIAATAKERELIVATEMKNISRYLLKLKRNMSQKDNFWHLSAASIKSFKESLIRCPHPMIKVEHLSRQYKIGVDRTYKTFRMPSRAR